MPEPVVDGAVKFSKFSVKGSTETGTQEVVASAVAKMLSPPQSGVTRNWYSVSGVRPEKM